MGAGQESSAPPGAGLKYFCGSRIFPDCSADADVLCCSECGGVVVPDGCHGAGQLESPSEEGREQGGKWRNGSSVSGMPCISSHSCSFLPWMYMASTRNENQFNHSVLKTIIM